MQARVIDDSYSGAPISISSIRQASRARLITLPDGVLLAKARAGRRSRSAIYIVVKDSRKDAMISLLRLALLLAWMWMSGEFAEGLETW